MTKKGQHVVPSGDGWSVKKAGAAKASSTHANQEAAIQAATRIARNQQSAVYVHGRDGRIRLRNSYGKDPSPSKD